MITGIISTIFRVLFKPVSFFTELAKGYSLRKAFLFYFTLVSLTAAAGVIAAIAMTRGALFGSMPLSLAVLAAAALIYIIFNIVFIFISVAVMHIFVFIFRGKGGYSGTFNVLVFSNTASSLYGILVFLVILLLFLFKSAGSFIFVMIAALIGALWLLVIPIIGYRIIHKMGALRSISAFAIPTILFIALSLLIPGTGSNKILEKVRSGKFIKITAPVKSQAPAVKAVKEDPPIPILTKLTQPSHRLIGIGVSGSGKPNAIINDKIVCVGDTVDNATVTDIKKDSVTLSSDGKEIVLQL